MHRLTESLHRLMNYPATGVIKLNDARNETCFTRQLFLNQDATGLIFTETSAAAIRQLETTDEIEVVFIDLPGQQVHRIQARADVIKPDMPGFTRQLRFITDKPVEVTVIICLQPLSIRTDSRFTVIRELVTNSSNYLRRLKLRIFRKLTAQKAFLSSIRND